MEWQKLLEFRIVDKMADVVACVSIGGTNKGCVSAGNRSLTFGPQIHLPGGVCIMLENECKCISNTGLFDPVKMTYALFLYSKDRCCRSSPCCVMLRENVYRH